MYLESSGSCCWGGFNHEITFFIFKVVHPLRLMNPHSTLAISLIVVSFVIVGSFLFSGFAHFSCLSGSDCVSPDDGHHTATVHHDMILITATGHWYMLSLRWDSLMPDKCNPARRRRPFYKCIIWEFYQYFWCSFLFFIRLLITEVLCILVSILHFNH